MATADEIVHDAKRANSSTADGIVHDAKRAKSSIPDAWKLTFHQTTALRTLIDVVSNVINRVNIKVVSKEDFRGISVESIDSKRVCLIAAQLACKIDGGCGEGDVCFCVDTTTLSTCLRSVSPLYSIDVARAPGSEEVVLRSYEIISNNYTSQFKLPTLAHDNDDVKLHDIDYDYFIEFDLFTLRSIVKNCIALKGENISIMVEEPKVLGSVRHTRVTVRSEGNAEQTHVFHSATENVAQDTGEPLVIRATGDTADLPTVAQMHVQYDETFSAAYLNSFMKNMEKNSITMRLAAGKPLVLSYPLGIENSSICFVLAAKAGD